MRISLLISIVVIAFISGGCSGNGNPVVPLDSNVDNFTEFPVGVTDRFPDSNPSGGSGMLGLFNLSVDPLNASASLVPIRKTALTDVLEVVDITNFLSLAPCTDCAKIESVSLDADGHIVVSIGVKHPFDAGDPLKPITGRNRADLHVFNIEGIVISNASGATFPSLIETVAGFRLLNASGYTGYLDDSLDGIFPTGATLHPYKLHFDDYSAGNFDPANPMGFQSVTDPPPSGNLVMAMGCDYDYKDYVFEIIPSTEIEFIYAIGCTYAVSAGSKNQRFTPEYRIPQHNKKAASEVSIEIVSNDLNEGDPASTAEIEVRVVDLNHNVPVGVGLNEMFADSSVDEIAIEIPGVMLLPLTIDGSSSISGSGHSPSDPLIYEATITNSANATEGEYAGIVRVTDSYSPGLNGSPLLSGMDGIKRVSPIENPLTGLFDITKFETYQIFTIDVSLPLNPTVTGIQPESADQHSFVGDAVITGTSFINVVSVRLEKGTDIIEADSFTVDSMTQITADFDLLGYPYGFYDVVVEIQGAITGRLDEGFEIILKCGTTPPSLDNVYTLSPQTNSSYVCAILNTGPYANYTIYPECNVASGGYVVFNHMTQTNNTPIIGWPSFQASGNAFCMEPANYNGLMIIQASYAFSQWQVVNQTTGVLVQNLPHNSLNGIVGDLDANDNFWGIVNRRPNATEPNVYTYHLQRWNYNPSNPSNPYSLAIEYDVTTLFADWTAVDRCWEVFGDLVILPDASFCYVLTGAQGTDDHKVDKVSLTGPAPTIVLSHSFAGDALNTDGQITIAQSRAVKMELDTSDSSLIPCRLVVAGTKSAGSGDIRYLNIYRFDADLNLLGQVTNQYNIASNNARKFYGMAIDMENKVIVHLTEFPSTVRPPAYYGYYGITKLPADW